MKILKTLSLAVLSVCLAASCQKATRLSSSVDVLQSNKEGIKGRVSLQSDVVDFSLEHKPEWLSADIYESTLLYQFETNEGAAARNDSVVITCGGLRHTIPVIQSGACTKLEPESNEMTFEQEGGEQTMSINTDAVFLDIQAPEGILVSYKNGILKVNVPSNEGKYNNQNSIVLKADEQTAIIRLVIKSAICQRCSGAGKVTCTKCKGEGEYYCSSSTCEYADDWGHGHTCRQCGGDGDYVYNSIGEGRWGSGKMTCPDCGGSGK